jgi:hypothetical protein
MHACRHGQPCASFNCAATWTLPFLVIIFLTTFGPMLYMHADWAPAFAVEFRPLEPTMGELLITRTLAFVFLFGLGATQLLIERGWRRRFEAYFHARAEAVRMGNLQEQLDATLQTLLPKSVLARLTQRQAILDRTQYGAVCVCGITDFASWSSSMLAVDVVNTVAYLFGLFDLSLQALVLQHERAWRRARGKRRARGDGDGRAGVCWCWAGMCCDGRRHADTGDTRCCGRCGRVGDAWADTTVDKTKAMGDLYVVYSGLQAGAAHRGTAATAPSLSAEQLARLSLLRLVAFVQAQMEAVHTTASRLQQLKQDAPFRCFVHVGELVGVLVGGRLLSYEVLGDAVDGALRLMSEAGSASPTPCPGAIDASSPRKKVAQRFRRVLYVQEETDVWGPAAEGDVALEVRAAYALRATFHCRRRSSFMASNAALRLLQTSDSWRARRAATPDDGGAFSALAHRLAAVYSRSQAARLAAARLRVPLFLDKPQQRTRRRRATTGTTRQDGERHDRPGDSAARGALALWATEILHLPLLEQLLECDPRAPPGCAPADVDAPPALHVTNLLEPPSDALGCREVLSWDVLLERAPRATRPRRKQQQDAAVLLRRSGAAPSQQPSSSTTEPVAGGSSSRAYWGCEEPAALGACGTSTAGGSACTSPRVLEQAPSVAFVDGASMSVGVEGADESRLEPEVAAVQSQRYQVMMQYVRQRSRPAAGAALGGSATGAGGASGTTDGGLSAGAASVSLADEHAMFGMSTAAGLEDASRSMAAARSVTLAPRAAARPTAGVDQFARTLFQRFTVHEPPAATDEAAASEPANRSVLADIGAARGLVVSAPSTRRGTGSGGGGGSARAGLESVGGARRGDIVGGATAALFGRTAFAEYYQRFRLEGDEQAGGAWDRLRQLLFPRFVNDDIERAFVVFIRCRYAMWRSVAFLIILVYQTLTLVLLALDLTVVRKRLDDGTVSSASELIGFADVLLGPPPLYLLFWLLGWSATALRVFWWQTPAQLALAIARFAGCCAEAGGPPAASPGERNPLEGQVRAPPSPTAEAAPHRLLEDDAFEASLAGESLAAAAPSRDDAEPEGSGSASDRDGPVPVLPAASGDTAEPPATDARPPTSGAAGLLQRLRASVGTYSFDLILTAYVFVFATLMIAAQPLCLLNNSPQHLLMLQFLCRLFDD